MDLNKKCFITKDIFINKKKIKFMYHEQPDNEFDSGWRFFSGDETQEYFYIFIRSDSKCR